MVYFHGGGWVIGSLRTCDTACAELCGLSNTVVMSVDYRLAPEHPFPAAPMDALNAFDWIAGHHDELGVDPARLGVAGDSAGGNLAAVVAQHRRDRVRYQLLVYPCVDLHNKTPSRGMFPSGLFLNSPTMDWFERRYITSPEQRLDTRVSPLLTEDLTSVPPACVLAVGFDPLRDEVRAYASRLDEVGALDELLDEPSLTHACWSMTHLVDRAAYLMKRSADALRRGLSPSSELLRG